MKLAAMLFVLLLLPAQLFAASGSGLRNFIINESYDRVMEALEDPETIKEAMKKLNIEVVSFHVNQLDASVEKELRTEEKAKFEATAQFTAHLRATYQGRRLNVHLKATVFRGSDASYMQIELAKPLSLPQTTVTCCWARIDIQRRSKDSTLLKAQLHLRATEPYRLCRLVRRIQHNIAQRLAAQYICSLLCQVEREIRTVVATYEPTEIEIDALEDVPKLLEKQLIQ
jgi:hypothetical protein